MAFYLKFFLNMIKVTFSYRANSVLKMINRLIFMIVQIEIWKIVYGYDFSRYISTGYGVISLHDMIAYTILSHFIFTVVQSTSLKSVNEKISNGDIALYLIRPYSFLTYMFAETTATAMVSMVIQGIPLLLFGIVFFQIKIESINLLILAGIALINGFIIFFLLSFLSSLISFWVVQTGPLDKIISGTIKIFSGVWIPLWFFSEQFLLIANILPFKTIYFAPLSIFINKLSSNEICTTLFIQLIWILILFIAVKIIWFLGQKKLVIQGG